MVASWILLSKLVSSLNDTATLSIEDVKPTGLGEYILSTSVTNAENYLQTESEPLVAWYHNNSVESMGTVVNIGLSKKMPTCLFTQSTKL